MSTTPKPYILCLNFSLTILKSRVILRSMAHTPQICPNGTDCPNADQPQVIYHCDDCDLEGCAACMDAHQAEGHWTDSDGATARAL